ncbi:MAG: hypothetical protein A2020_08355 [Lentisphaerae bacterium GWF2_45_14]|nr:MAG: hypothetical protein A2020_08355 [Lentisphaerae bacterium GWF2_45_14]
MIHEIETIVVGSGPAGLMAAIAAASLGRRVLICEKLMRPGLKLLASGGGKCNISNILNPKDFCSYLGKHGRFTLPALELFPSEKLREFLASCGVKTEVSDGFHIFPVSKKASDVLEALLAECHRLNVEFQYETEIKSAVIEKGHISGVISSSGMIKAEKLIMASGGMGYPNLGGGTSGYKLAAETGHNIVKPLPAMTGLTCSETWVRECPGISFKDALISLQLPKYRNKPSRGELIFTHNGISGPSIIDFAGDVSELLAKHVQIPFRINFFADKTAENWLVDFMEWQKNFGKKQVRKLLAMQIPQKIAENLCHLAGISEETTAAAFNASRRKLLSELLSALPIHIDGTESWKKAMITRGGVSLKNVDPHNLESRIVKGLFFAGEVLDIDGPCGGFNLQWAFSSGFLAGQTKPAHC